MLSAEETIIFSQRGDNGPAVQLTPAQDRAANELLKTFSQGSVSLLRAESGMGRTTVLRHVHAAVGGAFVGARQFIDALMVRRPDAIEQAFVEMLEEVLASHDTVVVDDLHKVTWITAQFRYSRSGLLDTALDAVLASAAANGRRIVFGYNESSVPQPLWNRTSVVKIAELTPEDYRALAREHFSSYVISTLDFVQIHRTAPALTTWQFSRACKRLAREPRLTTEAFIRDLNTHDLTSNVDLGEVAPVDWKDLKGIDDVIAALEAKIALPFENAALAPNYS
jgi:hypothetical protein